MRRQSSLASLGGIFAEGRARNRVRKSRTTSGSLSCGLINNPQTKYPVAPIKTKLPATTVATRSLRRIPRGSAKTVFSCSGATASRNSLRLPVHSCCHIQDIQAVRPCLYQHNACCKFYKKSGPARWRWHVACGSPRIRSREPELRREKAPDRDTRTTTALLGSWRRGRLRTRLVQIASGWARRGKGQLRRDEQFLLHTRQWA